MSDLLLELNAKGAKKAGALLNPAELTAANATKQSRRAQYLQRRAQKDQAEYTERRLNDIRSDFITFDKLSVKEKNQLRARIQQELDSPQPSIFSYAERESLKDALAGGTNKVANWIKENPTRASVLGLTTATAGSLTALLATRDNASDASPKNPTTSGKLPDAAPPVPAAAPASAEAPKKPETLTDKDVAPRRSTMSGRRQDLQPSASDNATATRSVAAPAAVAAPADKAPVAAPAAVAAPADKKAPAKKSYGSNVLGVGVNSKRVGELQNMLNTLGYTDDEGKALTVDNDFGNKTKQAVMKLQQALKDKGADITVDGKWGNESLKAISTVNGATSALPVSTSAPVATRSLNTGSAGSGSSNKRTPIDWAKIDPKTFSYAGMSDEDWEDLENFKDKFEIKDDNDLYVDDDGKTISRIYGVIKDKSGSVHPQHNALRNQRIKNYKFDPKITGYGGSILDRKTGNPMYTWNPKTSSYDPVPTVEPEAPVAVAPAPEPAPRSITLEPEDVVTVDTREEERRASESITNDILKLAGLKPITERDFTQGLTKVKKIQNLTESTELNECGGMGMSTPTNASLSITATAGSGDEVASMLQSIMTLAGLKPVTQDMMPMALDPMPMVKAMDIVANPDMMSSEEPTSFEIDSDGNGESDIEVDVVDADSLNAEMPTDDEEKKTEEGFEDATTKPNPQMLGGKAYGEIEDNTNKRRNFKYTPPGSGSNPLMKPRTMGESVDSVTADLFKAYESFKNGQ